MSEHLRYLAAHAAVPLSCMPNAGLPELTADGAHYPLTAGQLADAHETFAAEFGLALVGGCCGTTPEHLAEVVAATARPPARPRARPGPSRGWPRSTSTCRSARTPRSWRSASAPTPTARRRSARRCSPSRYDDCVEIARGADPGRRAPARRLRGLRRPGRRRRHGRGGRAARHRGDPAAGARLHRARGDPGRPGDCSAAAPSSTRSTTRTATGPESRIARIMPLVSEHGAAVIALTIDEQGQARTAEWKVAVATRLIEDLTGNWGMRAVRHHRRLPDVPDRHRPGGDPAGRDRDHRGDPRAQAALPRGADHARRLERLVRPQPGRARRAQLGLPRRVRAGRARLGDRARVPDHADSPDPRGPAAGGARPGLRPAARRATTRWRGCWSCSRASTRRRSRPAGPPSWPGCRCGSG